MPQPLVDQLAVGGLLVVPVAGQLYCVERRSSDEVVEHRHGYYSFVPLR